ncbi:Endoplasmic reticulum aminopeptidase 2 [Orchesella cincta]|uniref:Aminopeptidase n=1 Tax=Orchesella cincta TaxID=48709 RepID=A0A1D2M6S3_ORCCI|nr:Endoplasmic reticulum aminopeptidase 2 [Orchesella cincta]
MLQQLVLLVWIAGTSHVTEAQYHPLPVVGGTFFENSVSLKPVYLVAWNDKLPPKLNTTVIPLNYIIRMRPILQNDIAPSEVTITVESVTNGSCNTIVLNQKDLNIFHDRVTVTNLQTGKNMSIVIPGVSTEAKNESCLNKLPASGKYLYTISLEESFQLGDQMQIFIPYEVAVSDNNQVGLFKPTNLWPYHAKSVFPCFDDPSLKATFNIIIGRLDGQYRSISNMEIGKTEPDMDHEGWVWDHYEETVKMSPYLVCMIVSDFHNETILINNGTLSVSTWAPKHDIEQGRTSFGTRTVEKTLQYYEKKFKMNFPLRKLDAAVVQPFSSTAMENFGLVTYSPHYFYWAPGTNTERDKRRVADMITHEATHQWFGNVVTCANWEDMWLNEGFAQYLQFWAMNETIPEFEPAQAFVNDITQLAMKLDQTSNGYTLKMPGRYDSQLVYRKGASMLKMMEGFLTIEVLEAGVIDVYLQKMKWKSVTPEDFFEAIQETVEMHNKTHLLPHETSIKDIMLGWTLTSRFPLVRVNTIDQHTIQISQEKFNTPAIEYDDDDKGSWWIPIKIVSGNDLSHTENIWLPKNVSTLNYTSSNIDTTKLLMVNPDATGYYRVLYDEKLLSLIAKQLRDNHTEISSSSRSQLLDDYFNLALANYTSIETALELTRYLEKESSSNVWTAILHHLNPILNIFTQNKGALEAFKNYFLPRLEGALTIIGVRQLEGQRGINVTLRAQLLDMACQLDMPACVEYANELMSHLEADPQVNPFPLDIGGTLFCAAVAASSDEKMFDLIRHKYLGRAGSDSGSSMQIEITTALACTKNTSNIKWLLTSHKDLGDSYHSILHRLATNPAANSLIHELANGLSSYWSESGNQTELQEFIDTNERLVDSMMPFFKSAIQNTQSTMKWWKTFGNKIHKWLAVH